MRSLLCAALTVCAAAPAWSADLVETTDFSGDRLAPSTFALASGANSVTGSVGYLASGALDRDYLALTVPAGHKLDSMVLGPATSVGGAVAFLGVQAGTVMTVSPTANSAEGLLGWTHFGSGDIGQNILPEIGAGSGATGFSGPLGAGTYTFWIQDFSDTTVPYQFLLAVSPVPEAPALPMAAAALSVLLALRWKNKN